MAKTAAAATKKPMTKSEVYASIAESTGLSKKQVAGVFDALTDCIKKSLTKGAGVFAVPGLCKMTVKKKPATKARKGRNPFTGEEITIKAKPASKAVRIRPLKSLKEMIA
ncbi:MAG: HU family DNA-binding protein [Phycisphaeraceae bacterium]|nr:HU family DNA-binding protein [Phycisphaeraceae bacterium]